MDEISRVWLYYEYGQMRGRKKDGYGVHSYEQAPTREVALVDCLKLSKKRRVVYKFRHVNEFYARPIFDVLNIKYRKMTRPELHKILYRLSYEELIQVKDILSRG